MMNAGLTTLRSAAHYAFPRTCHRLIRARDVHDEVEMALLPLLVDREREAIDVGANVGRYAHRLTRLATHVHVYEPHPRMARILRATLPSNTSVHQVVVSDGYGETMLVVPVENGRQDEGRAHVGEPGESSSSKSFRAATVTLDALEPRAIGFVKVDVEGHEVEVLTGATRLFRRSRPVALVEAEDDRRENAVFEVRAYFEALAYDGFYIHGGAPHPIASFDPQMQDRRLFAVAPPGAPRRSVPYVNNFIFVPREMAGRDLPAAIEWTLRSGPSTFS